MKCVVTLSGNESRISKNAITLANAPPAKGAATKAMRRASPGGVVRVVNMNVSPLCDSDQAPDLVLPGQGGGM
ncbi:hypothetical protein GCM10010345_18780 [Streptomyces canarius]|uniref:Uncharacterized protein n=1 Tax=Streptomyces canarius TaxID=285453 RepID=A0ABQ3CML9_9ACTN|nr:hypothetical protein GCM10010345_18780 [Streptomyces canarius]